MKTPNTIVSAVSVAPPPTRYFDIILLKSSNTPQLTIYYHTNIVKFQRKPPASQPFKPQWLLYLAIPSFSIKETEFYPQCIYVFHVSPRINSNCFPEVQ
jgi:hypothetical protein